MRRVSVLLLLVLASAAQAQPARRTQTIGVEDYFSQVFILGSVISPDGKSIAYLEASWPKGSEDRQTDLCVASTSDGTIKRLGSVRPTSSSLMQWSSDSRWIYFANRRSRGETKPPLNGVQQVWRIAARGGDPEALTRANSDIQGFAVSSDGRALYYQVDVPHLDEEWRDLKEKFNKGIEYGHGNTRVSQIWRLDLGTNKIEKVIDEKRYIREFALAPDARRLALITTPDDKVVSLEGQSRVDVADVLGRKIQPLPDKLWRVEQLSPYGWLERIAWSTDSKALAFNVIFDGYPAEIIVADLNGDTPRTMRVPRREGQLSVRGYGSVLQWRNAQDLCFLGEEKARVRLCCATSVRSVRQGPVKELTPGDVVVDAFTLSANGEQAALVLNDTTHLPDLYVLEQNRKARRLLNLNPRADTWKLPQFRIVTWKGARGDQVEGILELPPDWRSGQRVPLVVELHGGPTSASYYRLDFSISGRTLLPSRGYAVLSPNYRGSTGYGDKFLTDLLGRENDIEVEDILKGVEAMVEEGYADKDRLGVMGWSNGGYLTNCLLTKTTLFKAASSGAGIVDTVLEWGTNDEPAYVIALKQGLPWDKPDIYRKTSPTYNLNKIRTPTLIHVGSNDERCPPGHSRMLHRALKEYVKVPTELVIYTGEAHGLSKANSRRAKMEWDVAWFDRYILGRPRTAP